MPTNVLIVDDDPDLLDLLAAQLRLAHLTVETATDGESALEKIRVAPPEVVVSDVRMPEMSGYELCRRLRESEIDDLPFIFCSSLGDLPERIFGLRMGADDYVVKPVNPEELLLKIRRQLEKSRRLSALKNLAGLGGHSVLRGSLGDVSVSDILQIVGLLNLGELCVRFDSEGLESGEIFVSNGSVVHARLNVAVGAKAFFRILGWNSGTFELEHRAHTGEPSMAGSLAHCILQGLASLDQYRHLRSRLEATGDYFVVNHSPDLFVRHFDEATAEILALIEAHHHLDRVLGQSRLVDLEAIRIVSELLATGAISAPLAVESP